MIDRRYVEPKELTEVMAHLGQNCVYYIAGSSSVYVPAYRCKYLDKYQCKPWTDIDGLKINMPPGEAARTELKREWPTLKRVGWNKRNVVLFDKRPPLHYGGQYQGPAVYVDLSGAYHQIYSKIWLDTSWPRGLKGRLPLAAVAERLSMWKAARNAVVGISRSRTVIGVKGRKRKQLYVKNPYLSPGLWATVQDVLHWVAEEALRQGSVYINTDGYMFPGEPDCADGFLDFLMGNEFGFKIKATGMADIAGWNSYAIGQKQTQVYKLKLVNSVKEFSNVNKYNPRWPEWWGRVRKLHRCREEIAPANQGGEERLPEAAVGDINL